MVVLNTIRVWNKGIKGLGLLPNTDFSSCFTGVSGGKCRWELCGVWGRLLGGPPFLVPTKAMTIAEGPAPPAFTGLWF